MSPDHQIAAGDPPLSQQVLVLTIVLLPLAWMAAAAANLPASIYERPPSAIGVIATLAAVGDWLVVAFLAGRRAGRRFIPLTVVFWFAVLGTPVVFTLLKDSVPSETQGGAILLLLLIGLLVPLYGFTPAFPAWRWTAGQFAADAMIVRSFLVAAVVFVATLLCFFFARRMLALVTPDAGVSADAGAKGGVSVERR